MRLARAGFPAVALVALALAPFIVAVYPLQVLTQVLIYVIAAMSLDLLFGYTGMASLGHALYFGMGGYVAGLLALHLTSNALLGLLFGAAAGAVSAFGTGWLAIRSRSVYFIMLTLALSELAFSIATSWSSLTGGDQGLIGIPPAALPGGIQATGVIDPADFYWYAAAVTVIVYIVLRAITRSSFGLSLVGIRENELRMRSLGYPTYRYKFTAYIIAGALAGVAGALYVQYSNYVSPDYIGFDLSALLLVMVMVGGGGTLYGAVLGSALVVILRDELSASFQQWEMVLGVVFVGFVYLLPSGLAGLVKNVGRLIRQRASPASTRPPAPAPEAVLSEAAEGPATGEVTG